MSHSAIPTANKAASALLHLGLTLTFVLALMFFVVHFGQALHIGEALIYVVGIGGGLLILRSVLRLGRELAAPLPASRPRRAAGH